MKRLLVLVLLTGCGQAPSGPALQAPEFTPYVEAFEQAATSQGVAVETTDIEMTFTEATLSAPNTTGTVLAICEHIGGAKRISVNRAKWDKLDEERKEALVFHELGHCSLDKHHDDSLEDGEPVSIMHPKLLKSEVYKKNKDKYMKELFL